MRKMYEWRPIADMPKRIQKDCMIVYRYAPYVSDIHASNNRGEMHSLDRRMGCDPSHFMIIHKYKEE